MVEWDSMIVTEDQQWKIKYPRLIYFIFNMKVDTCMFYLAFSDSRFQFQCFSCTKTVPLLPDIAN